MNHDPIVDEVRRVRDELARRFDYDLRAIGEDLMRRQRHTLSADALAAIRSSSTEVASAVRERPARKYKGK